MQGVKSASCSVADVQIIFIIPDIIFIAPPE